MDTHELKTIPSQTAGGDGFSKISNQRSGELDSAMLARLGKKQQLKRRFGFLSLFGFSCTILTTWEALSALFLESLLNGGPAGSVYGFIIAWICSTSVYLVIGELASMAPIAGGQYYWVSMLAPRSQKRFYSYMTGWLTTIAWIATVATGAFVNGTMIQGLIVLNFPDYVFERWHGTLLTWALVVIAVFINTVLSTILPQIEGMILILHVLGFFGVMIPLVWLSPHASNADVFKTWLNGGGWSTQGLSFCIGIIGNVATFVGSDAAVHMSEEIENAAMNVPRAIITTMVLNGALGFGMMLSLLYCLGPLENLDSILESPTGFPFIQIFVNGTKSVAGSTAMAAIICILGICATIGFLASGSRMTWSFARDRGLPFSSTLVKLDKRTSIPFIAVGVVAVIPCLLALINIGNSAAFNAVISLSVSGFYASYLVPASLLLYRRVRGEVLRPSDRGTSMYDTSNDPDSPIAQPPLVWGPWRIPGAVGTANNAFACVWMVFVVFWSVWPSDTPTTAQTMNYSVLVTGAALLFSVVYYYAWGHKTYKGPLMEVVPAAARLRGV